MSLLMLNAHNLNNNLTNRFTLRTAHVVYESAQGRRQP
jgi:hypothetical protein